MQVNVFYTIYRSVQLHEPEEQPISKGATDSSPIYIPDDNEYPAPKPSSPSSPVQSN